MITPARGALTPRLTFLSTATLAMIIGSRGGQTKKNSGVARRLVELVTHLIATRIRM